jgi:type I restriction enzyme S subunit
MIWMILQVLLLNLQKNKTLIFGRMINMQISKVNRSELNPESRLDAEYYRPQILEVETKIRSKPHWMSGSLFDVTSGPFGSTVTTDKYDQNTDLRYIRGKDVFDFFIDDSDPVNIQKGLFDELPQFHLKPLDLLVTVVGMNFGKTALVFPENCPAIFSCKSSLIRNIKVNPFYLTTYLSSKYGYALVRRGQRGAAQPGINLFDLRNIPVPMVSEDFQGKIQALVVKSKETKKASEKYYSKAESLLLEELNLNNWAPPHKLTFVRKYSEVSTSQRLDSEYFQPKYQAMFGKVKQSVRLDRLGKLITYKKGWLMCRFCAKSQERQ